MTTTYAAKVAGARTAGSSAAGPGSAVPERFRSISPLKPGESVVQEQLRSRTDRPSPPPEQKRSKDDAANVSDTFTAPRV